MTKSASEIFAKPIRRDGCLATPEQQCRAWDRWDASRGYIHLAASLDESGAQVECAKGERVLFPFFRIADAMMQKARKAGIAECKSRKWVKKDAKCQ